VVRINATNTSTSRAKPENGVSSDVQNERAPIVVEEHRGWSGKAERSQSAEIRVEDLHLRPVDRDDEIGACRSTFGASSLPKTPSQEGFVTSWVECSTAASDATVKRVDP
jgi:hypothetical protein